MDVIVKNNYYGLNPDDAKLLWKIFTSLSAPSEMAILNFIASTADIPKMKAILEILGVSFGYQKYVDSNLMYSKCMCFNIAMRYYDSMDIYIEGKNIIALAYHFCFPYVNFFITYIIIPLLLKGIHLDIPVSLETNNNKHSESILEHLAYMSEECSSQQMVFIRAIKQYQPAYAGFLFHQITNPERKEEIAMVMDDVRFHDQLSDESPNFNSVRDVAIFLNANKIYASMNDRNPSMTKERRSRDFQIAVSSFNVYVMEKTCDYTDELHPYGIKECLDIIERFGPCLKDITPIVRVLKILISKNVKLCSHDVSRIPAEWREELLGVYQTPRWKNMNDEVAKYYAVHLDIKECVAHKVRNRIRMLVAAFDSNPNNINKAVKEYRIRNKAFYIFETSTPFDITDELLLQRKPIKFANTECLGNGDDVFLLPRAAMYSHRSGDLIYMFDIPTLREIVDKRINPYTREPFNSEELKEFEYKLKHFTDWRSHIEFDTVDEVFDEIVNGRKLKQLCGCDPNNPSKRLSYLLEHRGIDYLDLESIHLPDLRMKLTLMGYDVMKSETKNELFTQLLTIIESEIDENKELIKLNIASAIKIQQVPIQILEFTDVRPIE